MKSTRTPNLSSLESVTASVSSNRGLNLANEAQAKEKVSIEELGRKISGNFRDDDGPALRLGDEFDGELITLVTDGCRQMILENSMGQEDWRKIGEFLQDKLWEFSRLKEELVQAERKCGMVKQKAAEISEHIQSGTDEAGKRRQLGCAMLLLESELRRDHLAERVAMIIDQFTSRILADFSGKSSYTGLELRLRAVFGNL